jgi:hypothetical protein
MYLGRTSHNWLIIGAKSTDGIANHAFKCYRNVWRLFLGPSDQSFSQFILISSTRMEAVGLSLGAVSLLFQVFSGCVKGNDHPELPCNRNC